MNHPGYQLDVRAAGSCADSPAPPRWPDAERTLVVVVAVLLRQLLPCTRPAPAGDLSLEKPLPGRLRLLGRSRPGLGRRAGTDGLDGSLRGSQQDGGRTPCGFRPAGPSTPSGGGTGAAALAARRRFRDDSLAGSLRREAQRNIPSTWRRFRKAGMRSSGRGADPGGGGAYVKQLRW